MMHAAKAGEFRAIVVYRLDRISRNISDFASLIETLGQLGIAFISIREQFDTGTPMGRAMMYIASVFSQLERETIAERIRDNMHELAKTGRWLGGTTPTGFTSERVTSINVNGKSKKACHLKLIPEEAALIQTIYALYLETDSLTMTEAELIRQKIHSKRGREFTRFSIRSILQNPVYMAADGAACRYFLDAGAEVFSSPEEFDGVRGILAYNRTHQEKGRPTTYLPINQWIISVGQHPGIIPSEQWIRVQDSLERNKNKAYRKPRCNEAILTGILYCRCGGRMYPKLTGRKLADGTAAYTYLCKTRERSRSAQCTCRSVGGNALDLEILLRLDSILISSAMLSARLEQHGTRLAKASLPPTAALSALRKEHAECTKKITVLIDTLSEAESIAARQHIEARIEQLHDNCESLALQICELEKQLQPHALSAADFAVLCNSLPALQLAKDASLEQKRAAVRTLVRKVVWDGNTAHLLLAGSAESALPLLCEDSK